jgi:hypothetical protein
VSDAFDPLIGEWEVEVPAFGGHGRTIFERLGAFVLQRSIVPDPGPDSVSIIGDGVVNYFDARGVKRIYQTSLDGRVWKIWRDDPDDFSQRFSGTLAEDGRTISAAWEKCMDGKTWEFDFEMIYTRISPR